MISVEKTDQDHMYVKKALEDNDFLEVYKNKHKCNSLDECINHHLNLHNLVENFEFYVILKDSELLGYFGSSGSNSFKYLTTFFIEKSYRNHEFRMLFLNYLYDNLGNVFGAYSNNGNDRAEKFLIKLGGELITSTKEHRLYLFKRSL